MKATPDQAARSAAEPAIDKRALRNALGAFVTGVTIVTTANAQGQPAGLTANSFNSVSLDPPMVLWSLALDSTSLQAFRHARWWAVHVLAAGQEALSNRFAQRDCEKFAGLATAPGPGGIPLLEGSAARFVCRAAYEHEGGDHAIFLGIVEAFEASERTPLVYHQGRYGGIFPQSGATGREVGQVALASLTQRGLAVQAEDGPKLTETGRAVAHGFVALAGATLTGHEVAALRHLLGRLA